MQKQAMPGMQRHYTCAPRSLLGREEQSEQLCPSAHDGL